MKEAQKEKKKTNKKNPNNKTKLKTPTYKIFEAQKQME